MIAISEDFIEEVRKLKKNKTWNDETIAYLKYAIENKIMTKDIVRLLNNKFTEHRFTIDSVISKKKRLML